MSYLGIDIGTSGAKAIAFDEHGNELASAKRTYSLIRQHPVWAELDAEMIGYFCMEIIREVAIKTANNPIASICISCQGEAFTAIDELGKPLCYAMVSSDSRAKQIAQEWPDSFGRERLYDITGHTAHPLFSLFKIIWLKDNQPEVIQKAKKILCFEEYLQFRLGIEPSISFSLAGRTMMFDVRKETWSDEILAEIGIKKELLSPCLPSGSIVGVIPRTVTHQLNLPDGVIVVSGGHDQGCGALGSGIVNNNTAMYALGSVECLAPAFDVPEFNSGLMQNNFCTYHHAMPGLYLSLAYSLTGGNIIDWFCHDILGFQNSFEISAMLDSLPENPTDLDVLPYFTPSGTPYFDSQVKGSILGLRLGSSKQDMLKALIEGVSMEMRLNIELLKESGIVIEQFNVIGGGAQNRNLLQLKADILGIPMNCVKVNEAGCLGAAMLGFSAKNNIKLEEVVAKWVQIIQRIEPLSARHQTYQQKWEKYKVLYNQLINIYK